VSGLPHPSTGEIPRETHGAGLYSCNRGLRQLSHAKAFAARRAPQIYRPFHPCLQPRRELSRLKDWKRKERVIEREHFHEVGSLLLSCCVLPVPNEHSRHLLSATAFSLFLLSGKRCSVSLSASLVLAWPMSGAIFAGWYHYSPPTEEFLK